MTIIGTCALCKTNHVPLLSGHLVPKWAYKRIMDFDANGDKINDPVIADAISGVAMHNSVQEQRNFLCSKCEQSTGILENAASKWIVSQDRTFEFVKYLGQPQPMTQNLKSYTLDSEVATTLGRFAVQYIWKHTYSRIRRVNLGGGYQEKIRLYLLNNEPLPEFASIHLSFVQPQTIQGLELAFLTPPYSGNADGRYHRHKFMFFGLIFTVFIGKSLPEDLGLLCLVRGRPAYVVEQPFEKSDFLAGMQHVLSNVTAKGKLASLKFWSTQ